MTEDGPSPPRSADSYWLTRFVILRWLGFIYAIALFAAAMQILPLIGSHGLLPLDLFLTRVQDALGSTSAGFVRLPSLFWFVHSDAVLQLAAWAGFALSCVVVAGYANAIVMAALWMLYMSFVHVGQDWYGYGWEIQLLETGFLAIFLCPLLDGRPFPKREPPLAVIWLFRWLIFRIMLGAALIKLRGDSCWRDLTALDYHFETQPIPNPLSRFFHFLPRWMLKAGVLFNFLAELIAPWFAFSPRMARHIAGAIMVAFQFTLILGGNLSFLNWLTIVPALACFDDSFWAKLLPRALAQRAATAASAAQPSRPMQRAAWAVAAIVGLLSFQPVVNMISPVQIMNTSFDPLDLVNTYGAFGSVGRERLNVVFEGTDADAPDARAVWKAYPYQALPVELNQRPRQIAPYQPRLDWQMWFAAMSTFENYPWTLHLVWKLLHNDPGALSLFGGNPFPLKPPRYIRAVLYRYKFAPPGNPEGNCWQREKLGLWLPPLSADDPRLLDLLKRAGWLEQTKPARPMTNLTRRSTMIRSEVCYVTRKERMLSPMVGNAGSDARRKTALIVEGGAMRGAWAAGVLGYLQERGRKQYDMVYAASSGACSAAYFVADMWGSALSIWRELSCNVVRKSNFLRRKPIIDLAYLVDYVIRDRIPLSVELLQKMPTRFFIVLTDCHTGEPVYFHACDERVFAALRATASMPLATRGFDYVDDKPFADGGVSDPIPVQRAILDGATDITVVLTHNPAFRLKPVPRWMGRLAYPEFPKVAEAWTAGQNIIYNAALDLMKQPPPGIRIQVFRPLRPLPIGAFSVGPKQIAAALIMGHDEALQQMEIMEGKPLGGSIPD